MRDLEKKRATSRKNYYDNREYYIKYHSEYAKAHRLQKNRNNIKYNRKVKLEVLTHYGGKPPRCACCGETALAFLTIDHINGRGGELHRQKRGGYLYTYLRKIGYPLGFRVLCMNCNFAIGHYGSCPHQEKSIGVI